jgi:hypothetical protein
VQREASGKLIDPHVRICSTGRRMEQYMELASTLGSQVHTAACLSNLPFCYYAFLCDSWSILGNELIPFIRENG